MYNDYSVRNFAVMAIVWGVVGMLVGVLLSSQLIWPELNFDLPWTSFGRLRPLHTNAVIFAFGGSTLFATSYYASTSENFNTLFTASLKPSTEYLFILKLPLAKGTAT